MPNCAACQDRRHLRINGVWRRCECVTQALVHPSIKRGESGFPDKYKQAAVFPLRDMTYFGEYNDFRYRCWRSLLDYPHLSYEYLDAYVLVQLHFERAGESFRYETVRDLAAPTLKLVVLLLGVQDLPNKFIGPVLCQLLTMRNHVGLPTWVYSAVAAPNLRMAYTPELSDLLCAATYRDAFLAPKLANPSHV